MISCAGRIEIAYNNALDLVIQTDVRVVGVNVKTKPIQHHVPADEVQGDIKRITDDKIVYWALFTTEFDDFIQPTEQNPTMRLASRTWDRQSRWNCKG